MGVQTLSFYALKHHFSLQNSLKSSDIDTYLESSKLDQEEYAVYVKMTTDST